jgi:uncharacterized protein
MSDTTGNIATAIRETILGDSPDVDGLHEEVMTRLSLSADASRDLVYQVVAQTNAALFPPVTKLELILTEGCNLGCSYCFEAEMLGPRRMPLETAKAGVDLLFDYSLNAPEVSITHFGGEPTLNFAAIQVATEYAEERAKAAGKTVDFNMTSNGVRINSEMVNYFAEHEIKVLLSVDGLQATHDRHRRDKRGQGTFSRVMAALDLLKRAQPWIGVKMTVMPDNAATLFDDVVGLYELGANQFLIGYATGVDWPQDAMQVYATEFAKVHQWYEARKARGDVRIAELDEIEENTPGYFGCQAGRISVTVAVDGQVSPCSKILALNNKQLLAKLGDVKYGLTHILNRAELVSTHQVRSACEAAGIAEEYEGGCFAQNYEDNGSLFEPSLIGHQLTVLQRSACAGCAASCG